MGVPEALVFKGDAKAKFGGVMVRCLLDSASEGSLITNIFFRHCFDGGQLYAFLWLKVHEANDQER